MKTNFKKIVSVLLCCLILSGTLIISSFAVDTAVNEEYAPFRIHVSVNGDTTAQKGFCWYTHAMTESKISIFNLSMEPVNAEIEYEDVFEWGGNYCHKALVKGLKPGTEYYYTVGDGNVSSSVGTFVTDDGDSEFEFVSVADIQASSLENFLKGRNTLNAAYKTMPDAEFYINLGDFTNDSTNEEWDYYDKAVTDFNQNTTIVPISGNHDGLGVWNWFNNMFSLDTSESVQTLNGVNYSFDYGNAHFAVLNTNDVLSVSIPQLVWLYKDMKSTDKDWKIVLMHKSPYTFGKDGKWPDALYLQRALTAVCDATNVDLVMSGHDHQYVRTKKIKMNMQNDSGTTYVLCGTAGSKRYEIRPFLKGLFMNINLIEKINVQRTTDWDGTGWEKTGFNLEDMTNPGGQFNTISVKGGTLTFNSYVAADKQLDDNGNIIESEDVITNVDSFELTKEIGSNKAEYSGNKKTSSFVFYLGIIPSMISLAVYTFGEWFPKFIVNLPNLVFNVIKFDIF